MAELLRENKRALDKSIREIERERQNLQNQEKKLIAEIKKTAKQGQMVSGQTWAWKLWSSIAICFVWGGKDSCKLVNCLAFIRFSKVGFTCYVISRVWWFVMVSVSQNLSCLGVNLLRIEGHVCPCRECF